MASYTKKISAKSRTWRRSSGSHRTSGALRAAGSGGRTDRSQLPAPGAERKGSVRAQPRPGRGDLSRRVGLGPDGMLDDEVVEITSWDAIRVSPETVRAFSAGPDGLELLAFGTHTEDDASTSRSTGRGSLAPIGWLAVLLGAVSKRSARSLTWSVSTNTFATPVPPMRATASSSASAHTCWTITAATACSRSATPLRPRRWPLRGPDWWPPAALARRA